MDCQLIAAWDMGKGESAVLAAAHRQPDCEIVVDDHAARQCAQALGIRALGTLGVILRAQRRGLIRDAASLLRSLPTHGCHLAQAVLNEALRLAGDS